MLEALRQRLAVPPEAPGQNETASSITPTKTTAAARAKAGASQIGGTPKASASPKAGLSWPGFGIGGSGFGGWGAGFGGT